MTTQQALAIGMLVITLGAAIIADVVDEFDYLTLVYSNDGIDIITRPTDLLEKDIGRWTDVSVTLKNGSNETCSVTVESGSSNESFEITPYSEYGFIIPKKEDVEISLCGIERTIRVD